MELAKAAFNSSIGEALESAVTPDDESFDNYTPDDNYQYPLLLEKAYKMRPEIRQLDITVDLQNDAIGMEKAQWLLPSYSREITGGGTRITR